jgi:predicted Zn-dependent protease
LLALVAIVLTANALRPRSAEANLDSSAKPGFYLPVNASQLTVLLQPLNPSKKVEALLAPVPFEARRLQSGSGLQELAQNLESLYAFDYQIAEPLTIPDKCFDFERRQYDTELLMRWLESDLRPSSYRTVGLLYADVFQGDFDYLFGQARMDGKVCVASSARLAGYLKNPQLKPRERWRLLVGHEMGHTFGLKHSADPDSMMAYGRDLGELDRQATDLTAEDWQALRKSQAINWDK